jgi:AcrR family transcriptional regulator
LVLANIVNTVYFENMTKSNNKSTERPRERRRRARMEAILDQSMEIFFKEGADGLTMRRLADSMDLTPGALYRYFPGKGSILAGLGHRAFDRLSLMMDAAEETRPPELAEAGPGSAFLWPILARSNAYWRLCLDEPSIWRLLNRFLSDPKRMIPEGDEHRIFMERVFSQILQLSSVLDAATAGGVLDDGQPSQARALAILSALNGTLLMTKMAENAPTPFDPGQILRLNLGSMLGAWGASSDDMDPLWKLLDK